MTVGATTVISFTSSTCDIEAIGSALQGIGFGIAIIIFMLSLAIAMYWYD